MNMQSDKQRDSKSPTHEQDSSQPRSFPTAFLNAAPSTLLYQFSPVLTSSSTTTASGVLYPTDLPSIGASANYIQSLGLTSATHPYNSAFSQGTVATNTSTDFGMTMQETGAERYSSMMYSMAGAVPRPIANTFDSENSSGPGSPNQTANYNINHTMNIIQDNRYTSPIPFKNTNTMFGNTYNSNSMEITQTRDIKIADAVKNEAPTVESTLEAFHNIKDATTSTASMFTSTEDTYTHQDNLTDASQVISITQDNIKGEYMIGDNEVAVEVIPLDIGTTATFENTIAGPPPKATRGRPTKSKKKKTAGPPKKAAESSATQYKNKGTHADRELLQTGGVWYLNDGPTIPKEEGKYMSRSRLKAMREKEQAATTSSTDTDTTAPISTPFKIETAPDMAPPKAETVPVMVPLETETASEDTAMTLVDVKSKETRDDGTLDTGNAVDEAPPLTQATGSAKSTTKGKTKKAAPKAPNKKATPTPRVPRKKASTETVVSDTATESIEIASARPITTGPNEDITTTQQPINSPLATTVDINALPAGSVEDIVPTMSAVEEDALPTTIVENDASPMRIATPPPVIVEDVLSQSVTIEDLAEPTTIIEDIVSQPVIITYTAPPTDVIENIALPTDIMDNITPLLTITQEIDATVAANEDMFPMPDTLQGIASSTAVAEDVAPPPTAAQEIAPSAVITEDIAAPATQAKAKGRKRNNKKLPTDSEASPLVTPGRKRKSTLTVNYNESAIANQASKQVVNEETRFKRAKNEDLSFAIDTPMSEDSTTKDPAALIPAAINTSAVTDLLGMPINDFDATEDHTARYGSLEMGVLPAMNNLPTVQPHLDQELNTTTQLQSIEQQKIAEDPTVFGSGYNFGISNITYNLSQYDVKASTASAQLPIAEQVDTARSRNARAGKIHGGPNPRYPMMKNYGPTGTTFEELPSIEETKAEDMFNNKCGSGSKRKLEPTKVDSVNQETDAQTDPQVAMPAADLPKDVENVADVPGDKRKIVAKKRTSKASKNIIMEEPESAIQSTINLPIAIEQGDDEVNDTPIGSISKRRATATKVNYIEKTSDEFIDWTVDEVETDHKKETATASTSHNEQNLMEIDKDMNSTYPTSATSSTSAKEKEKEAITAENTLPTIAPVEELVIEKRGRGRAKAAAKPKPPTINRQTFVKAPKVPKTKATTTTAKANEEALDEKEVRETEIASTLIMQPITMATDEQEGEPSKIAAKVTAEMEAQNENMEQDERLAFLLTNKDSPLASADLRTSIPQWIKTLPIKDQEILATFVPEPDQIKKKGGEATLRPEFFSASNNFFWEAVEQWQTILSIGGFAKKNQSESTGNKDDASFKDDNYEAYWGERLKRDKSFKQKKVSKASGSGRGRGGRRNSGGRRA